MGRISEILASTQSGMDRAIVRKPAWRRYGPYGAGSFAILAAAAWWLTGQGSHVYRVPIERMTIATVTQGPFEDFIAVRGTVAPLITDYITTDQGGTIKRVLVEDGAMVKQGQPLIILSNPALQLQVAAQQLQLEETRFRYESELLDIEHQISKLKGDLVRDKILLDGGGIAPSIYEAEQEDYDHELKLRAATIASRNMEQRIRATQLGPGQGNKAMIANAGVDALTVRAPMDGQLTDLDAEVGQAKSQNAVLGQVNSLDRFKLTAQVDEFYLGQTAVGQEARFSAGDREYRARVAKLYPQVKNGSFRADLRIEGGAPAGIQAGQGVDAKIELGNATSAKMLPNGPFLQTTGGNWIFVLAPSGRFAVRRTIQLGRRNPDHVEVLAGLAQGEKAIVSRYDAMQSIDRVEFQN
jgi:HlyD family secretion protein